MIDESDLLWESFEQSGRVFDYLKYKGIIMCGESAGYGSMRHSDDEPLFLAKCLGRFE